MGWEWYERTETESIEDVVRRVVADCEDCESDKILACRLFFTTAKDGRTPYPSEAYLAIREQESTRVFAVVCPLVYDESMPRGVGIRIMFEDEELGRANCPQHILDLLSPTNHMEALKWRNLCRIQNWRRQATAPSTRRPLVPKHKQIVSLPFDMCDISSEVMTKHSLPLWTIAAPWVITRWRDSYGLCWVSDCIFEVYGTGCAPSEAMASYQAELIRLYQRAETRARSERDAVRHFEKVKACFVPDWNLCWIANA